MSKKPMYLKRRAGPKVAALAAIVLVAIVAWHFMPKQSKELTWPVSEELQNRSFQGKPEEITAPKSGIKAYYMKQDGGLTAMSFIFKQAGSAYEDKEVLGIANIAAQTLKEGAGWWSAKELRNLMGSSGIKISFEVSKDDFSGKITFPNEVKENALKYLREMLLNPHFEDKYVEAAKAQAIRVIESQKEDPYAELSLAFNEKLFAGFAYGNSELGTTETVAKINRRHLLDFVKDNLGKNNLYIGIVGNLSKDDAGDMVDEVFNKLGILEGRDIGKPQVDWKKSSLNIQRETSQNIMLYAAKGTCRKCDDFYPLYIANYILGGAGLNSRMNRILREKENLTYGISSWMDVNDKADLLYAAFSATPDRIAKAKELFLQLWIEAGEKGFTEEELKQAKDYLIASHNLRFASTIGIAEMLGYMQKYDLGIDFLTKRNGLVRAVNLQQLNQAAKKYFNDNLAIAEIGKKNK